MWQPIGRYLWQSCGRVKEEGHLLCFCTQPLTFSHRTSWHHQYSSRHLRSLSLSSLFFSFFILALLVFNTTTTVTLYSSKPLLSCSSELVPFRSLFPSFDLGEQYNHQACFSSFASFTHRIISLHCLGSSP